MDGIVPEKDKGKHEPALDWLEPTAASVPQDSCDVLARPAYPTSRVPRAAAAAGDGAWRGTQTQNGCPAARVSALLLRSAYVRYAPGLTFNGTGTVVSRFAGQGPRWWAVAVSKGPRGADVPDHRGGCFLRDALDVFDDAPCIIL